MYVTQATKAYERLPAKALLLTRYLGCGDKIWPNENRKYYIIWNSEPRAGTWPALNGVKLSTVSKTRPHPRWPVTLHIQEFLHEACIVGDPKRCPPKQFGDLICKVSLQLEQVPVKLPPIDSHFIFGLSLAFVDKNWDELNIAVFRLGRRRVAGIYKIPRRIWQFIVGWNDHLYIDISK